MSQLNSKSIHVQMKRVALFVLLTMFSGATSSVASGDSRTVEFPFRLSGDLRSEFRAKTQIVSPGTIVIEAQWRPLKQTQGLSSLTLVVMRPDGLEAVRRSGRSPLRLEHHLSEADLDNSSSSKQASWAVKLINENEDGQEIEGKLRITVPLSTRVLVNTQFTLLSLGNAQEMAFSVMAPGRLVLEANWQSDPLGGNQSGPSQLTLQLVHAGQDKTYARRRGADGLRIEQQVTELEIDSGLRWIARVQNEGQSKVKGLLKVTFVPSL